MGNLLAVGAAVVGPLATLAAQCTVSWNTPPPPAVLGHSYATCAWDADGPGPLEARLTVAYRTVPIPAPYLLARTRIESFDPATNAWSTVLAGANRSVWAMLPQADGGLLIAGDFQFDNGGPRSLARFDGTSWTQVGTQVLGTIHALAQLPNGDLVIAGDLASVGGVQVEGVARWDGATWHTMDTPSQSPAFALAVLPNGDLVAGATSVWRWTSNGWQTLGGGVAGTVRCLTVLRDGSLFAGGVLTSLQHMARFDGATWQPLGGANHYLSTSTLLPNGDLLIGGLFTQVGGVAAQGLARWNGSSWSPLGAGLDTHVRSVAATADGRIAAGGQFTSVPGGGMYVAIATPTCAPAVATVATGCLGPAGPLTLASERPWLGTAVHATASGFVANAIALAVVGFTAANVPLATIHPAGAPGCDLLASPDLLTASLPVAGVAHHTLPLPRSAALIGVTLSQQFAQLELGPQGDSASLSTSNAVRLTLGDY